ncbi:MAG: hypothetical protein FJ301_10055 [Planctomycetes bacterium]|nr:hypothetical protein [Planctomycetota bacterium]
MPLPSLPPPSEHARRWNLDPTVVSLDHGSFGACPRVVRQRQLRAEMERETARFVHCEMEGRRQNPPCRGEGE